MPPPHGLTPAVRQAIAALALAGPMLLGAPDASALDFRSLSETAAAYDAPSAKARPLFVVFAGTPVELVVSLDSWCKVRDSKGDLVWVERKSLAEKRTVIVSAERAQVRTAADDKAAVVFDAERDVVMDLLEAAPGSWVKVRHRDGQGGFVKAQQVWGL